MTAFARAAAAVIVLLTGSGSLDANADAGAGPRAARTRIVLAIVAKADTGGADTTVTEEAAAALRRLSTGAVELLADGRQAGVVLAVTAAAVVVSRTIVVQAVTAESVLAGVATALTVPGAAGATETRDGLARAGGTDPVWARLPRGTLSVETALLADAALAAALPRRTPLGVGRVPSQRHSEARDESSGQALEHAAP